MSDDARSISKGDYKNFMSKEIFEQPITIKNCMNEYIDKIRNQINLYDFPIQPDKIDKITLIACGTAYHSCLVAKYWFEEVTDLDVEVDIASEFRYRNIKFKKIIYIFLYRNQERLPILLQLWNYVNKIMQKLAPL